ncbi:MAG TPA: hypothetical protein PLZ81_03320 [Acidiphilium rubrum]|nr:hypothetical protein [Acidiphilium sp.]HQT83876.1 hypothetical protein [Acidiphilium rubrum]
MSCSGACPQRGNDVVERADRDCLAFDLGRVTGGKPLRVGRGHRAKILEVDHVERQVAEGLAECGMFDLPHWVDAGAVLESGEGCGDRLERGDRAGVADVIAQKRAELALIRPHIDHEVDLQGFEQRGEVRGHGDLAGRRGGGAVCAETVEHGADGGFQGRSHLHRMTGIDEDFVKIRARICEIAVRSVQRRCRYG